jgi:hypothetical protein
MSIIYTKICLLKEVMNNLPGVSSPKTESLVLYDLLKAMAFSLV